jgi:hypothetical protein
MTTRFAAATVALVVTATLVGCGRRDAHQDQATPTTAVTTTTVSASTTTHPATTSTTTTVVPSTTVASPSTTAAPATTAPAEPVAPPTTFDMTAIDAALSDLDAVLGTLDNNIDNPQGDQS